MSTYVRPRVWSAGDSASVGSERDVDVVVDIFNYVRNI